MFFLYGLGWLGGENIPYAEVVKASKINLTVAATPDPEAIQVKSEHWCFIPTFHFKCFHYKRTIGKAFGVVLQQFGYSLI